MDWILLWENQLVPIESWECLYARPPEEVNINFRNASWRERRSMHLSFYKITFVRNSYSESGRVYSFEGICSSFAYAENRNCEHENAVLCTTSNRIFVSGLISRRLDAVKKYNSTKICDCIRIPFETKKDIVLCLTFQQKLLWSVFQTTAMVMVYMKKNKLGRNLTDRVDCSVCPGLAVNRINCVHEAVPVNYIKAGDFGL